MKRLHFFELFTLLNLIAVALFAHASLFLLGDILRVFGSLVLAIAGQALLGIIIRAAIALLRKERSYLRRLRRRAWLLDTVRLVFFNALMIFTYGWLKLIVPLYRHSNFDGVLWELDRVLGFGVAPSVFLLDLFTGALRFVDWSYANIFYASIFVASVFFLSHPSRRIRIAFTNGNSALWLIGAWLYFLVPSLGPAYRFPEIWFAHSESLRITQGLQALLMRNWQNVLRAWSHEPAGPISIAFGIAAFPSLHVAIQTYVFLWMRRLWLSGQVLFGVFALAIFLGSMITGWHYLIDGLAGLLMAWIVFRFASKRARPPFRLAGSA
ncbi:MAG TPA: phosphatase PAP2 family protein [Thermoanaerobaculia bacterium]|nr:phosphatase PAP2 family protein [Thermoanaerobaculia bacterium]